MNGAQRTTASIDELTTALATSGVDTVMVAGILDMVPTLALWPRQSLGGATRVATLRFTPGVDGVQLSADNALHGLTLQTDPGRRAVFNGLTCATMGRLTLQNLQVVGLVEILADGTVRGGHVDADGVHIEAADARAGGMRPRGFGVEVVTGAWTLWNRQPDPAVTVTAELLNLSAGRAGAGQRHLRRRHARRRAAAGVAPANRRGVER